MQNFKNIEEILNYFKKYEVSKYSSYVKLMGLEFKQGNHLNNQVLQSNHFNRKALFTIQFKDYLVNNLNAERSEKGEIIEYESYLNRDVLAKFLNYKEQEHRIWVEEDKKERDEEAAFLRQSIQGVNLNEASSVFEQQKQDPKKMTAPVVALFCSLVHESKLILKGENENVQRYCKRICEEYALNYTDRVRQNFNGSDTKENRKKVRELILSNIDKIASQRINEYLESKGQTKQNLYG